MMRRSPMAAGGHCAWHSSPCGRLPRAKSSRCSIRKRASTTKRKSATNSMPASSTCRWRWRTSRGNSSRTNKYPRSRTNRSLGLLEVMFPHPDNIDGMALARVTIESRPPRGVAATQRSTCRCTGRQSICLALTSNRRGLGTRHSQAVLDRVVADLNQSGFFNHDAPKT